MPTKNSIVYRFRSVPVVLILAVWAIATVHAQAPAIQPTQNPLLWRIEGTVPSYLYGTIHIPDQRVLAVPDVVMIWMCSVPVTAAEPLGAVLLFGTGHGIRSASRGG